MYLYAKMREAEIEKKVADGEYQKQFQYFESNVKIREALEMRKQKVDRTLNAIRGDYSRAARDAEPILRLLSAPGRAPAQEQEELTRAIVSQEIKSRALVSFATLDNEMDRLASDAHKKWKQDIDTVAKKELVSRAEHDRLVEQVSRQSSAGEADPRLSVHAKEIVEIKSELAARTRQLEEYLSAVDNRLNALQKTVTVPTRISGAKAEDFVKVIFPLCALIVAGAGARQGAGRLE
jgi:DNA primase large subunit